MPWPQSKTKMRAGQRIDDPLEEILDRGEVDALGEGGTSDEKQDREDGEERSEGWCHGG